MIYEITSIYFARTYIFANVTIANLDMAGRPLEIKVFFP